MELKEIIPPKISFRVERINKELTLNLMTVEDNLWIEENYPGDQISEVFTKLKVRDILRIIARMLDIESKRTLSRYEIIEIDEMGKEEKIKDLSLGEKLFKLISDAELLVIIKSFFETKKRSNEVIKKLTEDEKKTEEIPQVGS